MFNILIENSLEDQLSDQPSHIRMLYVDGILILLEHE